MNESLPSFSIIIPTYQRPLLLRDCLKAISNLDYPKSRFEVIVVNDGEQPATQQVVANFENQLNVRVVSQTHGGPAKARNRGSADAKNEYYAFTDDDCIVSEQWLKALASRFLHDSTRAIGGRTINALSNNRFSETSQTIVDVVLTHFNSDPNQAEFVAANNMALSSKLFHHIGGFNEAFHTSEDRELCDRIRHQGVPLLYAPEVLVYHANPLTFLRFCRQHFNYGRGAHRFHELRARRNSGRLQPDLRFYSKLVTHPFNSHHPKRWSLSTLTLASQLANMAGYIWEGISRRQNRKRADSQ